jgi:hypothetical protein
MVSREWPARHPFFDPDLGVGGSRDSIHLGEADCGGWRRRRPRERTERVSERAASRMSQSQRKLI